MNDAPHKWTFTRIGGVDQVVLKTGEDIAHLGDLDQKLWAVLTMPAAQHLMKDALHCLDADKDGRIRVPDILRTVEELKAALGSLDPIFEQSDTISPPQLADEGLKAALFKVNEIIARQEKAASVDLADINKAIEQFSKLPLNGDGVVTPESANDLGLRTIIATLVSAGYAVFDASREQGIDTAVVERFLSDARAYLAWLEEPKKNPELLPAGERSDEALSLFGEIRARLDDYFRRCKIMGLAGEKAATNDLEAAFSSILSQMVPPDSEALKALPLAFPNGDGLLRIDGPLHPEYEKKVRAFFALTEFPGQSVVSQPEWEGLSERFKAYEAWQSLKPAVHVETIDAATLAVLVESKEFDVIAALIEADKKMGEMALQLEKLRVTALLKRDFLQILKNFVNLDNFYRKRRGIFQSGRLFLDSREIELCIDVTNPATHALSAGLSSTYLVYCDLTRKDGVKKSISAALTAGDADDIFVGRNGIFYDSENNDWDAVITKVVVQPISIREAFFSPYKWFVRTLEEMAMKRAAAAEAESMNKMKDSAGKAASVKAGEPAGGALPAPKKVDVGTVAAIGVALGSIGAMVTGIIGIFFGMGIWMPIGMVGIILLISGPSMLLAYMKLRKRNIGPLLNAEGWAVNGKLKINVPFGKALSHLSVLPAGSSRELQDPFAAKESPWKLYIYGALVIIVLLVVAWFLGYLDFLPFKK